MKVRATEAGFDGQCMRYPGEEFDMPDGARGKWFEPVPAEDKPAEPARRRKQVEPAAGDA